MFNMVDDKPVWSIQMRCISCIIGIHNISSSNSMIAYVANMIIYKSLINNIATFLAETYTIIMCCLT